MNNFLCPAVIHHGIENIAFQPEASVEHFVVLPVLPPDLANQISLRVNPTYELSKVTPEGFFDHFGDIQAPTVYAVGRVAVAVGIHPAPHGAENIFAWSAHNPVFVFAKLGKLFDTVPTFVVKFVFRCGGIIPTFDAEPGCKLRILLVLLDVLKGPKIQADMIKYTVYDDLYSATVAFLNQL